MFSQRNEYSLPSARWADKQNVSCFHPLSVYLFNAGCYCVHEHKKIKWHGCLTIKTSACYILPSLPVEQGMCQMVAADCPR